MYNPFAPKGRTPNQELVRLLTEVKEMPVDSPEYSAAIKNVHVLCQAVAEKAPEQVDTNTIVMAVTNIMGILLVLNYEKLNVVTSKTFGMIYKGRA